MHILDGMSRKVSKEPISTIYIGGGTPSQLQYSELRILFDSIHKYFDISTCIETTMECNPEDITPDYASDLKKLPINRLSFGIQTFDANRLKFLRRRHTSEQGIKAIKTCQDLGYDNISIDLMFGFPGECISSWESDISKALSLNVQHISAYSLMYSSGTELTKMLERGRIEELSDDIMSEMYKILYEMLNESGYEHYEISNFAIPGYQSKHNYSYWSDVAYIGLGAGAHSYDGNVRSYNKESIFEYMESIERGELCKINEKLTDDDKYNEYVMTHLRTNKGIEINELKKKFSEKHIEYFKKNVKKQLSCGNLSLEKNRINIKEEKFYISDNIISDLFIV